MAEIVNLRSRRKERARSEARAEAASQRARHGRTKAEKLADEAVAARLSRTLDGARLDED